MLKKCLIGLGIYTILAIGLVFGLIYFQNSKGNEPDWTLSTNLIKSKPSDRYGTYDQNDLVINDDYIDYKGATYSLVSIDGLKDKKIEDKINSEIKNTLFNAIDKVSSRGELNYAYSTCYANFSNVLSVLVNAYGGADEEYFSETYYLNYNLTNGEKLKITDLFVDNANLARLYYKGVYDQLALDNYYDALDEFYQSNPDPDVYFDDYVTYADEDEVFNLVKKYLALGDEVGFAFSEDYILINSFEENMGFLRVDFLDVKDIVDIYDKYVTSSSIFEKDDIGVKNVFNFSSYYADGKNEKLGFVGDNIFIDYTSNDGLSYMDETEKIDASYHEFIKKKQDAQTVKVDDLIKKVKSDKDNFYVIFAGTQATPYYDSIYDDIEGIWHYNYSNFVCFRSYLNYYKVPMNVYKETYRDKLYDGYSSGHLSYAYDKRFDYNYDEEGNLLPEDYSTLEESTDYYIFTTGECIDSVEKLFVEGFDYKSLCYSEFYNQCQYLDKYYSDEEINAAFENSIIEIDTYGIRVVNDDYPEIWCYINFSNIYPDVLRIL